MWIPTTGVPTNSSRVGGQTSGHRPGMMCSEISWIVARSYTPRSARRRIVTRSDNGTWDCESVGGICFLDYEMSAVSRDSRRRVIAPAYRTTDCIGPVRSEWAVINRKLQPAFRFSSSCPRDAKRHLTVEVCGPGRDHVRGARGFYRNSALSAGLHRYVTPRRSGLASSRSSYSLPVLELAFPRGSRVRSVDRPAASGARCDGLTSTVERNRLAT